jgi:hypothetical protein
MALQLSTQDGVILKQGMGTTGYEAQQMPTIITAQGVDGFKQRTSNMGGTYKHMIDNIINRENKTSYNI